jgi:Tfp pilus assembly protein PilF
VDERRRTLSRDDPVLIGTYLAEANALKRDGQSKEARAKFEWLVREIEEVHAEVMNDYGVFLLDEHKRAPDRGYAEQAEEFL